MSTWTDESEHQSKLWRSRLFLLSHLELLHQLADGLPPGANDASVGPRVQMDVLAHHLLQLGHQLLDRLTRLLHVTLVPRNDDQILATRL